MNHFPENLSQLRREAGYTQESLAEAMGVSRQAVSKWESGQAMPEAATLVDLADLLGCTLDQLMREELSGSLPATVPPTEEDTSIRPEGLYAAWCAQVDRFSAMVAGGVTLILLGVAATTALDAVWGERELIALPLLGAVAVAVFLFITGGMAYGDFQNANPEMPDCCPPEERAALQRRFRVGIAAAVAGILADVTLLVALVAVLGERAEPLLSALFLFILAGCVGITVYLGIQTQKYDLKFYGGKKKNGRDVAGAIMLTATAIYLVLGFTRNLWHPGWVVFPIGGILCGIIESLKKS